MWALIAIRIGWVALGLSSTALGVSISSDPMLQITSCELGYYPSGGIENADECNESILSHYGPEIISLLSIPAILCFAPAVIFRRAISCVAAAVLLTISFGALLIPASAEHAPPPVVVFGYYIPVSILALVLTGIHAWLNDPTDFRTRTRFGTRR